MKNLIGLLVLVITFSGFQSCSHSVAFDKSSKPEPGFKSNDHLIMAVLYQQKAAEYRALCYQAFNFAKMQIDNSSKMLGGFKKKAVVVDIDETMLDNSPYEAQTILKSFSYPSGWEEWINKSSALAVPGALEFAKYAESFGVEIYYISNRKEKYREQTLKNLQNLGFPYASNDHLMLKSDGADKEFHRNELSQKANIILLIGDNLNDFSDLFEKKSVTERFEMTDSLKNEFGNRFIILPNAMYGDWEGALYDYNFSLDPAAKTELRKSSLQGY